MSKDYADLLARLDAHEKDAIGDPLSDELWGDIQDAAAAIRELQKTLNDHLESESWESNRRIKAEAERDALLLQSKMRQTVRMDQCETYCETAIKLIAERDALKADAGRYRWAKEILGGDDTPSADRKAMAIAHQLMLGVQGVDAAIDAARAKLEQE